MSQLPKGWQIKVLGDVCNVERGSSPRPIKHFLTDDQDGVNWVKIGDTKGVVKFIHSTKQRITKEGAQRSRRVNPGDFILTNSMSYGKPYIMATSGYIHDGWFVLRLANNIDSDFFYSLLDSSVVQNQFSALAAGAVVKNISSDLVKKAILPIPPLPEQKRIVAILDEAFAGISQAIANTEKNLANARELFKSYLNDVFTTKGEGWQRVRVEEVCSSIIDCINKTAPKVDEPTPFKMIRTTNVRNGYVNIENVKYVTEETYNAWTRRQVPKYGDVLLTREAPLGEVGILLSDDKVFLGQRLVSYRTDPNVLNNFFLLYTFQSTDVQRQMQKLASGSTVQHMRVPDTKNLEISLPPISKQRNIVNDINDIKHYRQRLETIYQQKLKALAELKQSILQKAFTGELTKDLPL